MIKVNAWIVAGGLSAALLIAVIIAIVMASQPAKVMVPSGNISTFLVADDNSSIQGWLKATKTTTTSANRSTDVTNVIGIMAPCHSTYVHDVWEITYTGYCLGIARSSDGQNKAAVLESQLFKITHGEGDESRIGYFPYLGFGAWPHIGNCFEPTVYQLELGNSTVAFARNVAGFNMSGREFTGSLRGGYDQILYDGPNEYYRWNYLDAPVADCGHMFYFMQNIPVGTTTDFNITSSTVGNAGQSNITLHFRIRVPPSPENMSPEELQRYGIEKIEVHNRPTSNISPIASPTVYTGAVGQGTTNDASDVTYTYVANLTFEVT